MVLGVYWYYGFPEGIYTFEYFKWKPGYGGHANNPAELECFVEVANPERLLQQLYALIEAFPEGFIVVYRQENQFKIKTGSFNLYDYDFLLMQEVEKLLKNESAKIIPPMDVQKAELIRIFVERHIPQTYPQKKLLQSVSSGMGNFNAECTLLRMDCFLPATQKPAFIEALDKISSEEKINTFFYNLSAFENGYNLMLFFTNGRQGVNLQPKQRIDFHSFEEKVEKLLDLHKVTAKHRGGWDYYPTGNRMVVKIVDEKFILEK